MNQQVISIEVEDKPGVLTRISSLFSRRGFTIVSLSVANTHQQGISRFTIVTEGDDNKMEQVRKQCQKLIHVLRTKRLDPINSVLREFSIIKIKLEENKRNHINHTIDFYGGRLLNITNDTIIIEFSGSDEKIKTIYEKLENTNIIESIRTGKVGIMK